MSFDIKLLQKLALKKLLTVQIQEKTLQNNFQIILNALRAQDQRMSTLQKCCKELQNNQTNDRFLNGKYKEQLNTSLIKIEKQMLLNNSKIQQIDKNHQKSWTKLNALANSLAEQDEQIKKINQKVDAVGMKVEDNISSISKIVDNPQNEDKIIKMKDLSEKIYFLQSKLDDLNNEIKDINLNILNESYRGEKMHQNIFDNSNKTRHYSSNKQDYKTPKTKHLIINNQQMKLNQKIKEITAFLMNKYDLLLQQYEHQKNKNSKLFDQLQSQLQQLSLSMKNNRKQHNVGLTKDNSSMRLKTNHDMPAMINLTQNEDNNTFKRQILEKFRQLKENLIKAIKKMDKYSNKFEQEKFSTQKIQDRLFKLQAQVNEKVDKDTFSRLLKSIENKFRFIETVYMKYEDNSGGLVTKHQLSCLSCDHKLKNFKASIGTHILTTEKSRIKTNQAEYKGQSVLLKSSSRYQMPQLKK